MIFPNWQVLRSTYTLIMRGGHCIKLAKSWIHDIQIDSLQVNSALLHRVCPCCMLLFWHEKRFILLQLIDYEYTKELKLILLTEPNSTHPQLHLRMRNRGSAIGIQSNWPAFTFPPTLSFAVSMAILHVLGSSLLVFGFWVLQLHCCIYGDP